jgi:predicted Fe-Mo cluster-binding NifX family protein
MNNLKIAIPVSSKIDNPIMFERFGRANYFCIFDTEDDSTVVVANPAVGARGGAGPRAVEFLSSKQIQSVIVPQLGPNADGALRAAQITIFQGEPIPVKNLIDKWKKDELRKL